MDAAPHPDHRDVDEDARAGQGSAGRVVVAIPTAGRREVLTETVGAISRQTGLPDRVVVSVAHENDVDRAALAKLDFPVEVLFGPRGASRQRNTVLDSVARDDIVLFLDDDFLMAPDYVACLRTVFRANPDVVLVTGTVLADGVIGPGLSFAEGMDILARTDARGAPDAGRLTEVHNGYGCNMAVRCDPVLRHDLRFDEALPLYSWLEDVDFSRQLARHGRIVRSAATVGVHLGTKTGRTPGRRLGYSQIANPIYLVGKGTLGRRRAVKLACRNIASNLVYSIRPRPWTDSRGRLRGNLLALWEALRGRASPGRAVDL